MVTLGNLGAVTDAVSLIGVVLLEAIILYFVYGAAEEAFSSAVIERIKNF